MVDESDLSYDDMATLMGFEYETAMEDTEVRIYDPFAPFVHLVDLDVA
jgi:hypothetical protein